MERAVDRSRPSQNRTTVLPYRIAVYPVVDITKNTVIFLVRRIHRRWSLHSERRKKRPASRKRNRPTRRHEGQGGDNLPIRALLGGTPGSGRVPGGVRSAPSIGGSRRVDDGNVAHHKPARKQEHAIPPGPGSEGRGDT
jgi:hypothetical protein